MSNRPNRLSLWASDTNQSARRFLRSPLFPIFMIVFVDVLGFGITIPVLALYAQNVFEASASQIALMSTVFFVGQFMAAPQLGRLSDQVGRRPVLVLSQIGTCAALFLSGLAPTLVWLYIARSIDGLTGGNISVAQAYLNDITDRNNRARGLGIINAAFGSGFVFGPVIGALLSAQFGPRVPFYVAGCVSLVTISLSYFMLPESLPVERRKPFRFEWKRLAPINLEGGILTKTVALIMLIGFGSQLAFFSFQPMFVLWAEKTILAGRDSNEVQRMVGYILTMIGVFGVLTQFFWFGPLVKRFGEKTMVIAGNSARGVAWAVMAALPFMLPSLLVLPFMSIGGGVSLPALTALLTYVTPAERRGQAIGLLQSAQNIGSIAGPLAAGYLFDHIWPGAPMALAAFIMAITVAVAVIGLARVHVEMPAAAGGD